MSKKDSEKTNSKYELLVEKYRLRSQSRLKLIAKSKSMFEQVDFDENFIKRERRRRRETKQEIEIMRSKLPVYNLNDIRMFKLPYHEALILQLEEGDFINTKEYILQLFELNEQLRNEAGPQSFVWTRPILKFSDNELKKLSASLMEAETEDKKGNFIKEVEILLNIGIDFAFNYINWLWIAQEIIVQCIAVAHSNATIITAGKHEAISRYIYAKILFEKLRDYEKAEDELNIARELSKGKSWNVKAFLKNETDSSNTLFMNTNYLLHLCYMRQAKQAMKSDINKALDLATLARKRAIEACFHDGETMALYLKGQCELNLGDTKIAVSTFNKAYYIQLKLKSEKGICEARVELSKAYLMNGNTKLALNTLLALKTTAEEQGFQFYLAQAYRYLGEYYLNCGEPQNATPLLIEALSIFHQIGYMSEANQVRNLGALSSGLELMPLYIPLIQRTDKRCATWFENLIKLVKWKDSRERFWPEDGQRLSAFELLSQIANPSVTSSVWEINPELHLDYHPDLDQLSSVIPSKVNSSQNSVDFSRPGDFDENEFTDKLIEIKSNYDEDENNIETKSYEFNLEERANEN